jgi:hypothetical protein
MWLLFLVLLIAGVLAQVPDYHVLHRAQEARKALFVAEQLEDFKAAYMYTVAQHSAVSGGFTVSTRAAIQQWSQGAFLVAAIHAYVERDLHWPAYSVACGCRLGYFIPYLQIQCDFIL